MLTRCQQKVLYYTIKLGVLRALRQGSGVESLLCGMIAL